MKTDTIFPYMKSKSKDTATGCTPPQDTSNKLKIDYQLCFALYSTSRAITKQYTTLLKDLDVTYPQYLVLLILWEEDGLTIQKIARILELEGATTTPLIQRMEKLGLLTRERSKEDERRVHVYLTEKGKQLRANAENVPDMLGCALGVDDKLAQKLIAQLQNIKEQLNKE